MLTDHDDPTPYQGVAEMLPKRVSEQLSPSEFKYVSYAIPRYETVKVYVHGTRLEESSVAKRRAEYMVAHEAAKGPHGVVGAGMACQACLDDRDQELRAPMGTIARTGIECRVALGRPWAVPVNYDVDDEPSVGDVAEAVERAR